MMNTNPRDGKRKLKLQLLKIKYKVDDDDILECLDHLEFSDFSEEGIFVHEVVYAAVDNLITFPYIPSAELSEEMNDEFENEAEYSTIATFKIPGLEKYLDSPDYDEFIDRIQLLFHGGYSDAIELFHLPTSLYATSAEQYERDYADQPCTFSVGMFDQGGMSVKQVIDFLQGMKNFNKYIHQLIA